MSAFLDEVADVLEASSMDNLGVLAFMEPCYTEDKTLASHAEKVGLKPADLNHLYTKLSKIGFRIIVLSFLYLKHV